MQRTKNCLDDNHGQLNAQWNTELLTNISASGLHLPQKRLLPPEKIGKVFPKRLNKKGQDKLATASTLLKSGKVVGPTDPITCFLALQRYYRDIELKKMSKRSIQATSSKRYVRLNKSESQVEDSRKIFEQLHV